MKKFLSKVKYPLTAVLLLTLFLFMGCSTETSYDDYYDDEEEIRDYMTKEEAQSNNGLYILKDNSDYYPAPEGEDPDQVFGDNPGIRPYNLLFLEADSNIPVLDSSSGDKLVLFTSEEINTSEPRTIFPVVQSGYTIPVCYINFENEWSNRLEETTPDTIDHVSVKDMDSTQIASLPNVVESYSFCKNPARYVPECNKQNCGCAIFNFDSNKEIPIGYYNGSSYKETSFQSNIRYFAFDACAEEINAAKLGDFRGKKESISLTQDGYAVINTSDLTPGFYIAREKDDDELSKVVRLGNGGVGYVFKVK